MDQNIAYCCEIDIFIDQNIASCCEIDISKLKKAALSDFSGPPGFYGSHRGSTRVPPGFHPDSTGVPPGFHRGVRAMDWPLPGRVWEVSGRGPFSVKE